MIEAFKTVLEREKEKRRQGFRLDQQALQEIEEQIQKLVEQNERKFDDQKC